MPLHTALGKREELIKELYSWSAPERFWKPKERSWYVSYGTFFIVIIALFALLGEYIAIIAVLAFLFLWFVQGSIPPEHTTFRITGLGFYAYGKKYKWKDIKCFWFSETKEALFLNLDITKSEFMEEGRIHRLSLLIPDEIARSDIFFTLIKFLDYGEKDELGFNMFNKMMHGTYINVTTFIPEENEDQADLEEAEEFAEKFSNLTANELTDEQREEGIEIAKEKLNRKSQK